MSNWWHGFFFGLGFFTIFWPAVSELWQSFREWVRSKHD